MRQSSQGKSVLIVHHTGKSGKQRGTSKREDVLDTVIQLKPISEESEHLGASFEIHFEKTRGFFGDETLPIVATFSDDKINHPLWTWGKSEVSTQERVMRMSDEGMTRKEIAKDLGISRQAVHQHLQKMK